MDKLTQMKIFAKVAELGSFNMAAKHFDVTTSTVSRAVSDLEQRLFTKLLQRTTRQVYLTPHGSRYLDRCHVIFGLLDHAKAEIESPQAHASIPLSGLLRVHLRAPSVEDQLIPKLVVFQRLHRLLDLEISFGANRRKLAGSQSDVTFIESTRCVAAEAIAREHIGLSFSVACAAPSYASRNSQIHLPDTLTQHKVYFAYHDSDEPLKCYGKYGEIVATVPESALFDGTLKSVVESVCDGSGIGILPAAVALPHIESGRIVRVMPEYHFARKSIYAQYSPNRKFEPKIKHLFDFLASSLLVP